MKISILLVMVLISTTTFGFTMNVEKDSVEVPLGNTGYIEVFFEGVEEEIFLSLSNEKQWTILENTSIYVNGNASTRVVFSPSSDVIPEINYKVTLNARSRNQLEKQDIFVFVNKNSISVDSIEVEGDFIPTGNIKTSVIIKNLGESFLQNIKLKATLSGSKEIESKEKTIFISNPNQIHKETFQFTIPEKSPAGKYSIEIELGSSEFKAIKTQNFDVDEITIFFISNELDIGLERIGFKKIIENKGNIFGDDELNKTANFLDDLFYSGTEPDRKENGIYYWNSNLAPGEQKEIYQGLNPIPFILGALFLIIIYLFYKKSGIRKASLKKEIITKGKIRNGKESLVTLEIKNKTGKRISRMIVTDIVSQGFDVKPIKGVKMLKKIQNSRLYLKWEITDIDINDVRVVGYKIIPKMEFTETKLPKARINYTMNGKRNTVISGNPKFVNR